MDLPTARRRYLGRSPMNWGRLPPGLRSRIKEALGQPLSPPQAVRRIIREVRQRGDEALLDLSRRLEGAELSRLEVTPQEKEAALTAAPRELLEALGTLAERVRSYHQRVRVEGFFDVGAGVGRRVVPLDRVGIYIPGGGAAYPSTVLMTVIPAKVAGVREVVVASPPRQDGSLPIPVLAAASIAGADRLFKIGGAQAIAALAFGTQSVPRVDKLCGPGGLFVLLAKREVYGYVDIDGFYGPTETVVLADEAASPALAAAELLAQGEHDALACPLLLTHSPLMARAVAREVGEQIKGLERGEVARQAVMGRGAIVLCPSMEAALDFINQFAPEHLCLMVAQPWEVAERVRNAGAIFLGGGEAWGDYGAGPSHCLPTGGSARFASGLGVEDFLKFTSLVAPTRLALTQTGPAAALLARAEGLTAHAAAIERVMKVWGEG